MVQNGKEKRKRLQSETKKKKKKHLQRDPPATKKSQKNPPKPRSNIPMPEEASKLAALRHPSNPSNAML